jgi:hypothetical protein
MFYLPNGSLRDGQNVGLRKIRGLFVNDEKTLREKTFGFFNVLSHKEDKTLDLKEIFDFF